MAKKNKIETEQVPRKRKRENNPLTILGTPFEINKEIVIRHVTLLLIACIVMKFVVVFFTTTIFHSFLDLFDIGIYFEHAMPLLQGKLPYIDYQIEYPVLAFLPIMVAFIPAILTQNAMVFVFSFQSLMILCDMVTILCVYFIAIRIWDEKKAFIASLIYVTAFSTAYFVITKYDAFPTCLLMLAILFTIYRIKMKGYAFAGLGFFTKIFPAIAFPFMILHNSKNTSISKEIIDVAKVMVPLSLILMIPIILLRPEAIKAYLFATGSGSFVYANTMTYTLHSCFQGIGLLGVPIESLSAIMYILMGIVFVSLLYLAYIDKEKKPVTFLKLLLCALISVVLFTKFHSPQYIVWFTPLLCLLVADDIYKIILFYITQVFAYIEFPLMFGSFYTNLEYVNPVGSVAWYGTLAFFTFEYVALLVLIILIIWPKCGICITVERFFNRNKINEK
jgi:hypothetical protein